MIRRVFLIFSAGALGGLACSLLLWAMGQAGVTQAIGVAMAPSLTAAWLYPRIVWGGIWGALFILRFPTGGWFVRGLLFSLGPSLAALLWFLPQAGLGWFGLNLGTLTPLIVLVVNACWGLVAAFSLRLVGQRA